MKKFLLAVFVVIMLGYSGFSIYMVMGMQKAADTVPTDGWLFEAYAELEFENLSDEYCDTETGSATDTFAEKVEAYVTQPEYLETMIQQLGLTVTAEELAENLSAEPDPSQKAALIIKAVNENEYTAADLCNCMFALLEDTDLDGAYASVEMGDVGTAEYEE